MTTGSPATSEMVGRACPYCRFDLKEGVGVIACPVCKAVHHDDCWEENGGCAVALCAGGPSYEETPRQEPQRVEPEPPPLLAPSAQPAPPPRAAGKPTRRPPAPPPGPPPPQGRPSRSRWIPFIAATIILLGGATAAAIVLTRHEDTTTIASASPSAEFGEENEFEEDGVEGEEEGFESEDEGEEEATAATAEAPLSPDQRAQRQIQGALTAHFNRLVDGEYETAWDDLSSHEQNHIGSESGWIEEEQADNLKSFSLKVHTTLHGSNSAATTIVDFKTHAALSGCNDWHGSWEMSKVYGDWLIDGVELEKASC